MEIISVQLSIAEKFAVDKLIIQQSEATHNSYIPLTFCGYKFIHTTLETE